jgi:hypothetical protein
LPIASVFTAIAGQNIGVVSVADVTLQLDLSGGSGHLAGFVALVAFLLSFGFIRMSTRLMRSPRVPWWPGSVKTGGIHIHHLVFGIVLLMLAGFLGFALQPESPWLEILAAGFGVGMGLTLDEFALWLHLEDVYWEEEGRRSVDAVIMAALLGGALLLGFTPWDTEQAGSALAAAAILAVVLAISTIAALKGKYTSAVIGILVALVGLVAAIRLAKPGSPWAQRRYGENSPKLARATARDERRRARYRRWQDRIGGAPSSAEPPGPA